MLKSCQEFKFLQKEKTKKIKTSIASHLYDATVATSNCIISIVSTVETTSKLHAH